MKHIIFNNLKNYLLAGLVAILPLWISYYVLLAVFRLTTSLAKPFLKSIPSLASTPFLLDIVSFCGTLLIVIGLGVLLTNMVGRRLFLILERVLQRVPVLSWIYQAVRKLTALFYQEGESRFQRVVMIEYPRKGIYVIGFMTTESVRIFNDRSGRKLVNIFLPTTPNPTSGFLLMVPKDDVIPLDISTEDAVKLIASGGVVAPEGGGTL